MLLGDECVCGSQAPLIEITKGRVSDVILLSDGRRISAHEVCVGLYTVQGIKQFQLIQESSNSFIVKVVKKSGSFDGLPENIVQAVEQKIGKADVEVMVVENVPRMKSGKFKQFISKIRHL
jgi:phenylacetate-coenzyme A ligase PaaK-like adenylate-forming protein